MEFNLHNLSLFLLIPASGVSFASRKREREREGSTNGCRENAKSSFLQGLQGGLGVLKSSAKATKGWTCMSECSGTFCTILRWTIQLSAESSSDFTHMTPALPVDIHTPLPLKSWLLASGQIKKCQALSFDVIFFLSLLLKNSFFFIIHIHSRNSQKVLRKNLNL